MLKIILKNANVKFETSKTPKLELFEEDTYYYTNGNKGGTVSTKNVYKLKNVQNGDTIHIKSRYWSGNTNQLGFGGYNSDTIFDSSTLVKCITLGEIAEAYKPVDKDYTLDFGGDVKTILVNMDDSTYNNTIISFPNT